MTPDSALLALKARQRQIWLAVTAVFVLGMTVYTMLCFIVGSDFLGMNVRSLRNMLSGQAITPHVYRQLVPVMTHSIMALTPQAIADGVTVYMHNWLHDGRSLFATAVRFRHPLAPPGELGDAHLYAFVATTVIDWLFLTGYVFYVWVLARRFFPQYFSAQVIAPCLAILAVPPLCAKFGYIYDFPVLFFSAWMTHVLLKRQLLLFTLMIAVVTFNKETSIYLIALFAMWGFRELPRRQWAVHLLCQCFLLLLVKGGVTLYYQQNPGEFLWVRGFYDHIITNMDGYSVYTFLGLVAAIALLGFRWEQQPYVLQCWMVLLPFSVLSWLIFGMRNEYRVMYEMFPALVLVTSHTLAYILQGKAAPSA